MTISLPHGYVVTIFSHSWRVDTGEKDFIGYYDFLTEAVNAAAEHYARKMILEAKKPIDISRAADTVTDFKSEFYSAMRGSKSPEEYL